MRPVGYFLLGLIIALLVVNWLAEGARSNEIKLAQHTPDLTANRPEVGTKGCFNGAVTMPHAVVLERCARESAGNDSALEGTITVVWKNRILAVDTYLKDHKCSWVRWEGGGGLFYGTVEILAMRFTPTYIDYGACGPTIREFMVNLSKQTEEARKMLGKEALDD